MGASNRERHLAEAFVSLADTMVADFDVIELLNRLTSDCVDLLPVDAAGLLLSDQRGSLRVVTYSSEQANVVEQLQIEIGEGPCVECFRTSTQVAVPDLRVSDLWPLFSRRAVEEGYLAVHAIPMRLRAETIGTLNLFGVLPTALSADDLRIGQALADVATIGILQERAVRRREVLAEQLESALNSRVVIEQAKGVLAERGGLDMAAGFALLRAEARATNQRLSDLARSVVDGTTTSPAMLRPGQG